MSQLTYLTALEDAKLQTDGVGLYKTANAPTNLGMTPPFAFHHATLRLAAEHLKAQGNLQGQVQILQLLHA